MSFQLHLGDWIESIVEFLLDNFQGLFDVISAIILWLTSALEGALIGIPNWILLLIVVALSFWRVSWKFALFSLVSMALIMSMGLWETTVSTLALVIAATLASLVIALPSGIIMAKSDTVESIIKPILDFMQTMPPFVYLIPAAMFFGLGKVPGTIATIIFAMPPAVRLTNLGIRQVPKELVEAGQAFGCTGMQLLRKVQIPSAMPSIMAGINQNVMMALSMVVIASMIGAGGLGNVVLRGIQRMDIGLGFEGGIGVVIMAILLDRISQTFGQSAGPSTFAQIKALFSPKEAE